MTHPEKLGKYRITEILGEGAMGVVYKAFDPDIQRVVALKTIRRELDGDSGSGVSTGARFRNEAQAAGRLSHPGIVAVYEYGQDDRVAYIAMEFVEGRSLAHYLASGVRFTDEDIPGVMAQLLDALDHAHEAGVWHRDIKPANIIMARNGRLKIADFGIARIDNASLTQVHTMIGTPAYMAPEQFLGNAIDRRVDIYSAGVLLYLLLTGKPPFSGSPDALMYKVVHEPVVMPSKVEGAKRTRYYDALLATALAKDPGKRFATAANFKQALEAAVGEPFDTTSWDQTIIAAPLLPALPINPAASAGAAQPTLPVRSGAWTNPPTHWDRGVLAHAETSLARHLGPLASVLVRRAARDCADLPALYARLAEQVSDPAARTAFLGNAAAAGLTTGGSSTRVGSGAGGAGGGGSGELTPDLLEQTRRLLAQHLGPIAGVVVKKAAAKTSQREPFFAQLAQSVADDKTRQKLLAEFDKLG